MSQSETVSQGASSGVDALIERLRGEGVEQGREEARRIVADAQTRATWMIEQAKRDAQELRERAEEDARRLEDSTREALRVAARDSVLEMRATLTRRFRDHLRWLVGQTLSQEDLLQRLILELAVRTRRDTPLDAEKDVEVMLPRDVLGLEELRRHPEKLKEGTLSYLVIAQAQEVLREGVRFTNGEQAGGLRVRLHEHEMELDISDEAVAELLLQHLQPRFRAMLEGIVK
ncbi:ATP synthase subunit A [Halomonas sp. PR-M31]|uniref:ATP synthase subunit A n=1 Tax=Halomonas sp. PR-M31 TaxID=1471202 RepID=UPI000650498B|nr:ATP synthase subunit A [Halomonas sp. PR-M31]